ncbi:MAG: exo-beta-N-acetylmuramidase NamZ domain-containing protein, partial [Terriglobales bacterium]
MRPQPKPRRAFPPAAVLLALLVSSSAAGQDRAGKSAPVRTGIDVLEATGLGGLPEKPKRVGLLTNQSGVDSRGRRTIDVLAAMPGVKLTAIFSPEHGLAGKLDTTEITEERDAATGVPVYSSYGGTDAKRRPPLELMKTLDAVLIDLQDVGARYYTYKTTVGHFLEVAAQTGTKVIVLDRPNPIGGLVVQGPVSDEGRESFI